MLRFLLSASGGRGTDSQQQYDPEENASFHIFFP
jgi:hypothetical protein